VEEALYEVANTVEFFVMSTLLFTALARWNDRFDLTLSKCFDDLVGIVSAIAQACSADNIVNEVFGYG
jgi:hypothetical protein